LALASAPAPAAMRLTSADLTAGRPVPRAQIHTRSCGLKLSPQLAGSGAPAATRSLVLTMIDLDVKPAQWSHWIVIDLPPQSVSLPRGVRSLTLPAKAIVSHFGDAAYDGPCPPPGSGLHHHELTLRALPSAMVAINPDDEANRVSAILARQALDRASLSATVMAAER
jgi:Raf kinase inhibitor-like YbhB/YbcL family protein